MTNRMPRSFHVIARASLPIPPRSTMKSQYSVVRHQIKSELLLKLAVALTDINSALPPFRPRCQPLQYACSSWRFAPTHDRIRQHQGSDRRAELPGGSFLPLPGTPHPPFRLKAHHLERSASVLSVVISRGSATAP